MADGRASVVSGDEDDASDELTFSSSDNESDAGKAGTDSAPDSGEGEATQSGDEFCEEQGHPPSSAAVLPYVNPFGDDEAEGEAKDRTASNAESGSDVDLTDSSAEEEASASPKQKQQTVMPYFNPFGDDEDDENHHEAEEPKSKEHSVQQPAAEEEDHSFSKDEEEKPQPAVIPYFNPFGDDEEATPQSAPMEGDYSVTEVVQSEEESEKEIRKESADESTEECTAPNGEEGNDMTKGVTEQVAKEAGETRGLGRIPPCAISEATRVNLMAAKEGSGTPSVPYANPFEMPLVRSISDRLSPMSDQAENYVNPFERELVQVVKPEPIEPFTTEVKPASSHHKKERPPLHDQSRHFELHEDPFQSLDTLMRSSTTTSAVVSPTIMQKYERRREENAQRIQRRKAFDERRKWSLEEIAAVSKTAEVATKSGSMCEREFVKHVSDMKRDDERAKKVPLYSFGLATDTLLPRQVNLADLLNHKAADSIADLTLKYRITAKSSGYGTASYRPPTKASIELKRMLGQAIFEARAQMLAAPPVSATMSSSTRSTPRFRDQTGKGTASRGAVGAVRTETSRKEQKLAVSRDSPRRKAAPQLSRVTARVKHVPKASAQHMGSELPQELAAKPESLVAEVDSGCEAESPGTPAKIEGRREASAGVNIGEEGAPISYGVEAVSSPPPPPEEEWDNNSEGGADAGEGDEVAAHAESEAGETGASVEEALSGEEGEGDVGDEVSSESDVEEQTDAVPPPPPAPPSGGEEEEWDSKEGEEGSTTDGSRHSGAESGGFSNEDEAL
eukprot:TRINITY_DN1987_c0_g1_i2.p1 TRINITY_DN1987_c0_g1~~TRINITY_DN1987_c0_g1_i2.p1  ORF type:complete len:803 (-),score=135.77 TRINITY_DN1987_c0_g1_i2:1540-3909(-)